MNSTIQKAGRGIALLMLSVLLTACGGGGGGGGGLSTDTSVTTTPDSRNGTYVLFGADGRTGSLQINFDTKVYKLIDGNGVQTLNTFTATDSSNENFAFTLSGFPNAKFRVKNNLIVGAHPLSGSSGLLPVVAARSFVTAASELSNVNMVAFGRDTSPTASWAFSLLLDGNTYKTCSFDTDTTVYPVASCPGTPPQQLSTYTLSFNPDGHILATDTSSTTTFYIAKAGSDLIYLRATQNSGGGAQAFRVGLVPQPALSGTSIGPTSHGDWGTFSFAGSTFSTSGLTPNMSGSLTPVSGVSGLFYTVDSSSVKYYFAQSSTVSMFTEAQGVSATGYLGIGLN